MGKRRVWLRHVKRWYEWEEPGITGWDEPDHSAEIERRLPGEGLTDRQTAIASPERAGVDPEPDVDEAPDTPPLPFNESC